MSRHLGDAGYSSMNYSMLELIRKAQLKHIVDGKIMYFGICTIQFRDIVEYITLYFCIIVQQIRANKLRCALIGKGMNDIGLTCMMKTRLGLT